MGGCDHRCQHCGAQSDAAGFDALLFHAVHHIQGAPPFATSKYPQEQQGMADGTIHVQQQCEVSELCALSQQNSGLNKPGKPVEQLEFQVHRD